MALNAFDAAETITLDLSSLELMDSSGDRVVIEWSSSGDRVVIEWSLSGLRGKPTGPGVFRFARK
jgi:anti-anti-sigma regulatory factor